MSFPAHISAEGLRTETAKLDIKLCQARSNEIRKNELARGANITNEVLEIRIGGFGDFQKVRQSSVENLVKLVIEAQKKGQVRAARIERPFVRANAGANIGAGVAGGEVADQQISVFRGKFHEEWRKQKDSSRFGERQSASQQHEVHRTEIPRLANINRRDSVRSSCTVVSSSDASIRNRRATSGSK